MGIGVLVGVGVGVSVGEAVGVVVGFGEGVGVECSVPPDGEPFPEFPEFSPPVGHPARITHDKLRRTTRTSATAGPFFNGTLKCVGGYLRR